MSSPAPNHADKNQPQPTGGGQPSEQGTESQRKGGKEPASRHAEKEYQDTSQQEGE